MSETSPNTNHFISPEQDIPSFFFEGYKFCPSRIFFMPKFMLKNKKTKIIGISIAILILLTFFGAFRVVSNEVVKQNRIQTSENIKTAKTILEINGARYENEITGSMSVYDFMDKIRREGKINFTEKNYIGMGKFIEEINGVKGNGNQNWIYYVNGKEAQVGVSNYKIKTGDIVSWKYEKANY